MGAEPTLDDLRPCLEGGIPAVLSTCSADGVPNVTYVSQVHRVDATHVALSFQFFNKTRENILQNPQACVELIDPRNAARYRLYLRYCRTEAEGPLFESMKAKLSGIASHTGMSGVFRLRGANLYDVLEIETVANHPLDLPSCNGGLLAGLRQVSAALLAQTEFDSVFDAALQALEDAFGMRHSLMLLSDPHRRKLYTVASRGYSESGVGAEIPFGAGVIGVAAEQHVPIRIAYLAPEYAYGKALRDAAMAQGMADALETEIPFPGLPAPHSQIAVPVLAGETLLGVLYAESPEERSYGYDEEDALVIVANQLGTTMRLLHEAAEDEEVMPSPGTAAAPAGRQVARVRHYRGDHSVFIDDSYLIKGVAGAILWKLLRVYDEQGREEFSNRELRLDPALQLPDIVDNLEARLILLRKRLAERCDFIRIDRCGRGRFRLGVERRLELEDAS